MRDITYLTWPLLQLVLWIAGLFLALVWAAIPFVVWHYLKRLDRAMKQTELAAKISADMNTLNAAINARVITQPIAENRYQEILQSYADTLPQGERND